MAPHSSIFAWKHSMDRGVWKATVHGVTKGQTRLSDGAQHAGRPWNQNHHRCGIFALQGPPRGPVCAQVHRHPMEPVTALCLLPKTGLWERQSPRQQTDDFSNSLGPGHPMSYHSRAQHTTTRQPGSRDSLSGGLVTLQRSPPPSSPRTFGHQLLQACTGLGIWGWVILPADECSENPAGAVFSQ